MKHQLFIILTVISSVLTSLGAVGQEYRPSDMSVTELKCEYQTNPIGLDEVQPRLSWKMDSAVRGQCQTAYRILVASDPGLLEIGEADLWDSGKIESDQSTQIIYQGKPLQSRSICYWRVMVWDKDRWPTPWSETASWSMGLLEQIDWSAKWIGMNQIEVDPVLYKIGPLGEEPLNEANWVWYPEGEDAKMPVATRYFRKNINVNSDEKVRLATIYMTADNSFNLWFNGEHIGGGLNHQMIYTFDVTSRILAGGNEIAISANNEGHKPNGAGLIGRLLVIYEDNTTQIIATDDTWLTASEVSEGWEKNRQDPSEWQSAKVLRKYGQGPWGKRYLNSRRRLPAIYLRKEVALKKQITSATAYISGLGYYKLHINGRRIGDRELDPILRDYDKQVPYVTYDVTRFMQSGSNAIGVMLGCGRFYTSNPVIPTKTHDYGYPRMLLQIEVEYADGTGETIVSDPTWFVTDKGPILNNNEYDGEYYDARQELGDWDSPDYDDSGWQEANIMQAPAGRLTSAAVMQPMRVTEVFDPVAVEEPQPGVWVYDFGQNYVGRCSLKVQGPAGSMVVMQFAENLRDDGTIDSSNLRSAECMDTYVLKGAGEETYTPSFTYHGFRYVQVTGYPGKPDLDALQGQVIHTDMPIIGKFECSDPILTQLVKNAIWGIRSNYLSIPTDCPQRDERQGWLGDRAAMQLGESYLFDNVLIYSKWMDDIRDAQNEEGIIPAIVPPYRQRYAGDSIWPSAFVIIPGDLYRQYGDIRIVERCYPALLRWHAYLQQHLEEGILARDKYGDWCSPPESSTLIHTREEWRTTPKEVLSTCYYYHTLKLLERYAELFGKQEDAEAFRGEAEYVFNDFNNKLYDSDTGCYGNGSQTSQVLPLAFGMVPEYRQDSVRKYLENHIRNRTHGHLGTGVVGGQWLLRTLSDNGYPDLAYQIATNKDYPSWGYMIENGATTIWELWNGDTADPAMNSGNHVMLLGDVITWCFEYLGGIKSDINNPSFKHIIMKPDTNLGLTWVRASFDSPYGEIVSNWQLDEAVFNWNITIPPNTEATIYLPKAKMSNITESGQKVDSIHGITHLRDDENYVVCRIVSGSYSFVITGL